MFSLVLTIFCSTAIALILKYSDVKKGDPIVLLAGNYFVAALISLTFLLLDAEATFSPETFLFGAGLGLTFVLAFFAFAKAVSVAGTALSQTSSRLSVVIPIIFSIIIYNEIPTKFHIAGFIFAFITIYLFYRSLRTMSNGSLRFIDYFYLFAVLLGIGINDFSMKVFQNWRPGADEALFIFSIFSFAFLYTSVYILFKGIKPKLHTVVSGAVLGVPNVFSTVFLLAALAQLPGIIVYPVINIGIILLTAVLAAIFWKEIPNKYGKWALFFGSVSIALLSL
jgi:drug/metabolite transporter (DMT)-like permease